MMQKKNFKKLQIIHIPLGEENPYKHELYERIPRYPKAGDVVEIGILTTPGKQGIRLTTELYIQNVKYPKVIFAKKIKEYKGQTFWKAQLPKVIEGTSYKYRIKIEKQGRTVYSKYYDFKTPRTARIDKLLEGIKLKDSFRFVFQTDIEDFLVQLILRLRIDKGLDWEWKIHKGNNKFHIPKKISDDMNFEFDSFIVNFSAKEKVIQISNKVFNFKLKEKRPTCFVIDCKNRIEKIFQFFHSPKDEAFYGFGERFNSFDQRGNILDNIVYEQHSQQDCKTYLPLPYFISSRGYGLFFNTQQNIIFDLAATQNETWYFIADLYGYEALSFCLWVNSNPLQIQRSFINSVGKPKLPPDWVFGLWISANRWNSQKIVEKEIDLNIKYRIPAKVVVIEAWSDEVTFCIWNDFIYPPKDGNESYIFEKFKFPADGHWPDPRGLCESIHKKGMKLIIWQNPVLKWLQKSDDVYSLQSQHALDLQYVIKHKLYIQTANDDPYFIPKKRWFTGSMLLDFSNPMAIDWWFKNREFLIKDIGVDGFKTDGGEHILGHSVRMKNSKNSRDIRNLYTFFYQKAYASFLKRYKRNDWVLFSRSGYIGTQRFSCIWAGDQQSSWKNLRAVIFAGLSAGLSGYSFWSFDLGGYYGKLPCPDLYLRSAAIAALCPIMQYHSYASFDSGIKDERTPWNIQKLSNDVDVIGIFRYFVNLRMNLMPYILYAARHSAETGLSMMQPLAIFFPKEKYSRNYPYQYMFGFNLLVAPVVKPNVQTLKVYLPRGNWFDFWTNELHEGMQVIKYPVPLDRIPVFVREGSILPLNLSDNLEIGRNMSNSVSNFRNLALGIYIARDKFDKKISLDKNTSFRISGEFEQESQTLKIQTGKLSRDLYIYIPGLKCAFLFLNGKKALICSSKEQLINSKRPGGFLDSINNCLFVKLSSLNLKYFKPYRQN
ncbi:MAG: TIM-barrel domain-containing protein [Actinomycetota bacterium]